MRHFDKLLIVVTIAAAICLTPATLHAAKLGKLFIKTAPSEIGGQQFANPELEDSVKDLKSRLGDFDLAKDEADADFLMIVIKRDVELKGHGPENLKRLFVTLSVRDGDKWKPGAQLSNQGLLTGGSWGVAAKGVIGAAEKWVKDNVKK